MNTQSLKGLSQEQLIEMITKMRATPANRLSLKVTEKGGVSCYGLGRFPVTLYRSQWERLLAAHEEISAFIVANVDKLATKD